MAQPAGVVEPAQAVGDRGHAHKDEGNGGRQGDDGEAAARQRLRQQKLWHHRALDHRRINALGPQRRAGFVDRLIDHPHFAFGLDPGGCEMVDCAGPRLLQIA